MWEAQQNSTPIFHKLEIFYILRRRSHQPIKEVHIAVQRVERNLLHIRIFLQKSNFPTASALDKKVFSFFLCQFYPFKWKIFRNDFMHSLFDYPNLRCGNRHIGFNFCEKTFIQRIFNIHFKIAQHIVNRFQINQRQAVLINKIRNLCPHIQKFDVAVPMNLIG